MRPRLSALQRYKFHMLRDIKASTVNATSCCSRTAQLLLLLFSPV